MNACKAGGIGIAVSDSVDATVDPTAPELAAEVCIDDWVPVSNDEGVPGEHATVVASSPAATTTHPRRISAEQHPDATT